MDRVTHSDYERVKAHNRDGKRVIVLCYEHKRMEISYALLKCDKDEYIKEAFKDWNEETVPFIYRGISYAAFKTEKNRNLILLRYNPDIKNGFMSVLECDVKTMRNLVSMQRTDY